MMLNSRCVPKVFFNRKMLEKPMNIGLGVDFYFARQSFEAGGKTLINRFWQMFNDKKCQISAKTLKTSSMRIFRG